jgi:hypothetical protein
MWCKNNFLWHKRRRAHIEIENNLNVETQKSNNSADTCINVAALCDHMNIQISHRNALEEK